MARRRRQSDEEFAQELAAHLAHETDRLVADGMTPEAARAAAHRTFGNVTRARERYHDARRVVWLEQFVQDLRYGWRGLWRSRAFVATTVLTLAAGMGLVTVVFAVFNAYVLRPFAVRDPFALFQIGWSAQEAGGSSFRWRDFQDLRARRDLFDDVVAEMNGTLQSGGRSVAVGFVSGNYFPSLGAPLALGRTLTESDTRTPGAEPVALLAYQTWTRLFDRDPGVLGREIEASGQKLVIVGVMAAEFAGLDDSPRDFWIPITMHPAFGNLDLFGPGQPRQLRLTARLRRDVTPEQAQTGIALDPFETRVAGRLDPVRAVVRQHATPTRLTLEGMALLAPVFAAFGLVLVAACANASNVMLARGNARHREIGIRLSIGASRGRVVRQLTTEGLLIALVAGLAGLALAEVLLRIGMVAFVALLPPTVAGRVRFVPFAFDYRVFIFAFVVAAGATLVFALLPALQSTRITLTDALRGHLSAALRSSTFRNLLVTGQVAVSLVLLIVAMTLVRNSVRVMDLGLDTSGVVSVRQYRSDPRHVIKAAYDALSADPRLGPVVVTSRNPLFGDTERVPLRQKTGFVVAAHTFVSPEYFAVLRIPVIHGRGFTQAEAMQEAPVAIVSAAGARALWPGEDPLGKTLRVPVPPLGNKRVAETVRELRKLDDFGADALAVTVIGVVSDVISGFVYLGTDPAHVYLPTSATGSRAAALMTRGRAGELSAGTVRGILERRTADAQPYDVLALDEMVALQLFPLRAASWLGSLLSTIALVLSVSGLYGVLTYTFSQRTQEIGVRMALGASGGAIVRLVAEYSIRLASLGTILGGLVGFSVMKLLGTVVRLENLSVLDAGAFAASGLLIAAAVALASFGPARRAARVDPASMLRSD